MYILKKILKVVSYKFIGRGAILYFSGSQEYLIGTENYVKNELSRDGYGVIIFSKNIQYKKLSNSLNDNEKKAIALEVKTLLAKDKIIAEIE